MIKLNKWFYVFMIISIMGLFLIIVGIESKVIGEQLCVDGNKNVNLEGIMCEKVENTWFGLHWGYVCILFVLMILSGIKMIKEYKIYDEKELK